MNPVSAPPNSSVVGEEGEEQHEKKPVLKKVKDKVKKIKNAISKKSHDRNEGGDNDQNQQRELDEGDNGFQDDEEINEDIAVHGVPTAGAGIVPQEISRGGRGEVTKGPGDVSDFINMDEFYQNQVNPKTDPERDSRFQQNQEAYVSPATSASSGAKERSTGELKGGETSPGVNDNFGLMTDDLTNDPTTPKADDEAKARDAWNQVHLSPTNGARTGLNEMSEREVNDAKGLGDGLSLTTVELVEDLAAPKTEAETNINTEQTRVGNEANISPDLCRSLDAMTISPQNKTSETNLPKSANNSYTNMVSSAASKVYEMVSDAGTAVISKVKPVGANDGEGGGDAAENQRKGISFTEYVKEKLTPGEDEKALSEVITEAGQRRRRRKIRETVSSLLGGGQGSPKSPQGDSHRKVAEDNVDLHSRPSEAN